MAKGAVAALDKANISHGVGKDVIIMGALVEVLDNIVDIGSLERIALTVVVPVACEKLFKSPLDDTIRVLSRNFFDRRRIICRKKLFSDWRVSARNFPE